MRVRMKHALFLAVVACGLAGNSAQACKLGSKFNQQHSPALTTSSAAPNDTDSMPVHDRTIVGLWNSEYLGADGTESVIVYDPTLSTILYQSNGTVTGVRIRANSKPL